ncbi:MAG: B12-binding domain-containing radical SAM protein [Terriglobia bacterium]
MLRDSLKVLLISPNNPFNCYRVPAFPKWASWFTRNMHFGTGGVFPGLNLAILAAHTPSDIEVQIIDESVEPIDFETDADLIGITAMTNVAPAAYHIADKFRQRGKTVVLGGVHVTVAPQEALPHCDAVVVGEAEYLWPLVIQDYRKGKLEKTYRADRLFDMQGAPLARRELLKLDRYLIPQTVETARGCPFDCDFCSVSRTAGRGYRFRPLEEVQEELRLLGRNRWVFFIDDIINGNRKRARELFRAIAPLKIRWGAQATILLGEDEELLELARESGCVTLFIGFETFSNAGLKKLGKPANWHERFFRVVERIHAKKIGIWGAFVFGLDSDTRETLEETVRVVKQARLEFAQFSCLTPLPGTALYRQYIAEGRLRESDWSEYNFGNVTFLPKNMSEQELKELLAYAWGEFYNWKSIRQRLSWRKPVRFPYGPKGFRSFFHVRNLLFWTGNIGISRLVQHGLKKGVRTRALGQPESEFERMRRTQGRPAEQPQVFGPRDPDTVPGAGELVILRSGSVDRPREPRPSEQQPSADD